MLGLALKCNSAPYHRCLILSEVQTNADFVVLVRITTDRGKWDQACVLTPAEWPELEHDSVVAYSTMKVERCKAQLERAIKAGAFSVISSPPRAVLKKICDIARANEFTPPFAKQHIAIIP
jgi:hypothetical protein